MSLNICRFYNPFFDDGCLKRSECDFLHLKQEEYVIFVQANSETKKEVFRRFKLAKNKFQNHKYRVAADILKSLLTVYPHVPHFNLWCARSMEKMNALFDAEIYYRKAISQQPTNPTFHGRYATLLHMKLLRFEQAKRHYEIALNIRDDINAVHCHYGKLLCDLGGMENYNKAKYHFNKCLQIYEGDEECNFYLGQLLYKLNDQSNAEKHIKKALCLQNKPYVWHYYYYSLICIELSKFNEAKQYLQICLDLKYTFQSIGWHQIYFEYGLLLIFIFDSYQKGLKYISIAINLFPTNQKYEQSVLKFQYQRMYEKLKNVNINEAKTLFNITQYNNYRQINKDKDFINNNSEIIIKQVDNDATSLLKESAKNSEIGRDTSTVSVETSKNESISLSTSTAETNDVSQLENVEKKCSVENEFYIFLKDMNLQHYYNTFKKASINVCDIRLIEHIDYHFLSKTIKMKQNDINLWMNNVNQLKIQRLHLSNKWKQYDRFSYTLFYNIFSENGISTIKSFLYYFKKPEDILYLVNNNYDDAESVWDMFQNVNRG